MTFSSKWRIFTCNRVILLASLVFASTNGFVDGGGFFDNEGHGREANSTWLAGVVRAGMQGIFGKRTGKIGW